VKYFYLGALVVSVAWMFGTLVYAFLFHVPGKRRGSKRRWL
jgi:hypothetical protein